MFKVTIFIERAARYLSLMGMPAVLGAGLVVAPAPAAAGVGTGALIVRIMDVITSGTVGHVLVCLYDQDGFVVDKTMTNDKGLTVFEAAAGDYLLLASADGYEARKTEATVIAGQKTLTPVLLYAK